MIEKITIRYATNTKTQNIQAMKSQKPPMDTSFLDGSTVVVQLPAPRPSRCSGRRLPPNTPYRHDAFGVISGPVDGIMSP